MKKQMFAVALFAVVFTPTLGFAQTGPVAKACEADIAKYCAGKEHTAREVRSCLETNRDQVSADCRSALDKTGGGRR